MRGRKRKRRLTLEVVIPGVQTHIRRTQSSVEGAGGGTKGDSGNEEDVGDGEKRRRLLPPSPLGTARYQRRITRSMSRENAMCLPDEPFLPPIAPRAFGDGVVGLENLGNTCFLNVVLQVISHTPRLRTYFIRKTELEWELFGVPKRGQSDDGGARDNAESSSSSSPVAPHTPPARLSRSSTSFCFRHVQEETEKDVDELSLSHELHNLLRVIWSPPKPEDPIPPAALLSALCRFVPRFAGGEQQDAQELMHFLLDHIHEELRLATQVFVSPRPHFRAPLTTSPGFGGRGVLGSIVTDLFEAQLVSTVTCEQCHQKSMTLENSMGIAVDLPAECQEITAGRRRRRGRGQGGRHPDPPRTSCSLLECLAAFVAPESLADGEPVYACETCDERTPASKRIALNQRELPHLLWIQVKRFKWTQRGMIKLSVPVVCPSMMDVAPFCASSLHPLTTGAEQPPRHRWMPPTPRTPGAPLQHGSTTYRLYAIIEHMGDRPNRGHYVAYIAKGDSWWLFNDAEVTQVDASEVESAQPYIVLYEQE